MIDSRCPVHCYYNNRLQQTTTTPCVSTDLLQQVDGVPAAEHLGGEGGGGGGAPVLLNLLQELGHRHALGHGAPQPGTHRDRTGTDKQIPGLTDRFHTKDPRKPGGTPPPSPAANYDK